MKNVKGVEIYSTDQEKLDYYDLQYSKTFASDVNEQMFYQRSTRIKDDFFYDIVLPFIAANGLISVLDVGAGWGKYASKFYDLGCTVTATEISPVSVKLLQDTLNKFAYWNIAVVQHDIDTEEIDNYDFIFMSDLVEHLVDYKKVWEKCLEHSQYMYALIPKDDSWNWSEDHLTRFDEEKIAELISLSSQLMVYDIINYDENNSWFALIVKGKLCLK
jgi:2-polyprenyl-3-methyl-5-hydroxy-6-metoxy-1,4-benzoquinol methylase